MTKDDIKAEIFAELSSSLAGFLGDTPKQFGTASEISDAITDEASAIIVIAKVNQSFHNNFLVPLSGYPFAEAQLRNGALNPTLRGILLASLEIAASVSNSRIVMISPTVGGVYYGAVTSVSCTADGAVSVSVSDGDDSFELTGSGGTWSGDWAFALGQHSITVTATYESGETDTLTVSFAVYHWDTYPQDGATLPAGPTSFELLNPNSDPIESVTVEGAGDPFELVANIAGDGFEFVKDLAAGAYSIIFKPFVDGVVLVSDTIEIIIE